MPLPRPRVHAARPTRAGVRSALGRAWREYTRMRTAILFLVALVVMVLVGSFVPQQDTSAQQKVDQFTQSHPNLDALFTHLGFPLTDVFVSPLFFALLVSLYIALGACVLRRGRALVMRTVRRHRRTPQYWGEWGSWLFHTSLFLLLVAAVWGKATGFSGIMTVTEGQTVSETRASFDTLEEGMLFDGHHAGYQVTLNHFSATYQADGAPADFVSNVTVRDHGRAVMTRDIRVNDFMAYDGVDFYQQDYGWAPHIVVRNPAGQTVYDGYVQFFGTDKSVDTGVLKVPDFGFQPARTAPVLQLGAQMAIFPDARQTSPGVTATGAIDPTQVQFGPGGEEARNPVLEVKLYLGDLGLDSGAPQNVNTLDTRGMQPYFPDARPVPLLLHDTLRLGFSHADGTPVLDASGHPAVFTVSFPDLRQYSLFMVKKDDGVPLIYASFGLVMTGLLTKLYLRPFLERRQRAAPIDLGRRSAPSAEPGPIREPNQERVPAGVGGREPPDPSG